MSNGTLDQCTHACFKRFRAESQCGQDTTCVLQSSASRVDTPALSEAEGPVGAAAAAQPPPIPHMPSQPLQLLHELFGAVQALTAEIRAKLYSQGAYAPAGEGRGYSALNKGSEEGEEARSCFAVLFSGLKSAWPLWLCALSSCWLWLSVSLAQLAGRLWGEARGREHECRAGAGRAQAARQRVDAHDVRPLAQAREGVLQGEGPVVRHLKGARHLRLDQVRLYPQHAPQLRLLQGAGHIIFMQAAVWPRTMQAVQLLACACVRWLMGRTGLKQQHDIPGCYAGSSSRGCHAGATSARL
jgi:hypothetical protein